MWRDSRRRFALDPGRVYVGGFPGGSRVATWFGSEHAKARGHLAMGGVLTPKSPPLNAAMSYYLLCGKTDFNRTEMEGAAEDLAKRKASHRLEVFEGGHELPPKPQLVAALRWLDQQWRTSPAAHASVSEEVATLEILAKKQPVAAYWRSRSAVAWFHGVASSVGTDAPLVQLLARLEKTATVRRELKSMESFERYRQAEGEHSGSTVLKRYRSLERQYRGTRGAKLASQRPAKLVEWDPGQAPKKLAEWLRLSRFYTQHLSAGGLPILASKKVNPLALREARYLIEAMLKGRDDIRQRLIANKVRFSIMAASEMTTAIPEHSTLKPSNYWDRRARGLGASHATASSYWGSNRHIRLR